MWKLPAGVDTLGRGYTDAHSRARADKRQQPRGAPVEAGRGREGVVVLGRVAVISRSWHFNKSSFDRVTASQ